MSPFRETPLDVFTCPLTGSALIEASAGTGKTWAITGLVLRLILERGLPVQDILVVTFTKAATAELRERIRSRLHEVLVTVRDQQPSSDPFITGLLDPSRHLPDPETLVSRLTAALTAFDEAAIFTIHGYCQRALGDTPLSAGQPFELTLGDDRDLLRTVSTDFWRTRIATLSDPLLAAHLADPTPPQTSPEWLETQLRRRLSLPLARYEWPEASETLPPADQQALDRYDAFRQQWQTSADDAREMLLEAARGKVLNGASYKPNSIETGFVLWDRWFQSPTLPSQRPAAPAERWCAHAFKLNKGKTAPAHPLFEDLSSLWAALGARQQQLETRRLALLREFLETAPTQIRTLKRSLRQASFDDLLHHLYEALTQENSGDFLAARLRRRYPAALIDEFQDTDPLQFAIFRKIYLSDSEAPTTLFFVGDPKQAIYSFRQADLHTYLTAREFAQYTYFLPDNQRACEALITAVNTLFSQHPAPFMQAGLTFQPVRLGLKPRFQLHDLRPCRRGPLHVWQFPDPPLDKTGVRKLAAQACAQEMAELLAAAQQGLVYRESPAGEKIPLRARDLAVLVRTNAQGRLIKSALAKVGLGAAELATGNVFASPEAAHLEILLTALAEPGRLTTLRAALTLPWMGLDAQAIHQLEDNDALSTWLLRFQESHRCWLQQGLAVAVYRLLFGWGLSEKIRRQSEGERTLTNLYHLLELLHEAEQGEPDPASLLRWLADHRAHPEKAGEVAQLRLESDDNLIRILTIHRAKGLEFPIVFCPFLGEGPGKAFPEPEGVAYPIGGAGERCIDFRTDQPPELEQGRLQARLESAAEGLRLIYVALTRAVDRCYLTCGPYFSARSLKDSQRALLHWLVAGHTHPEEWLEEGGNWEALTQAWEAISQQGQQGQQSPAICLEPIVARLENTGGPTSLSNAATYSSRPLRPTPPALPRRVSPTWRLGSFSGLIQNLQNLSYHPSPADRDLPTLPASAQSTLADDDILWFARGARAGECIHTVFELADFTDPATWPAAIEQALTRHPPTLRGRDLPELSRARLTHMLEAVLQTPLPHSAGFRLAGLGPHDRLTELEFCLPAPLLAAEKLQALCAQFGIAIPKLSFAALKGYLRGFMDLVFRFPDPQGHQRYAIVDWKSNYLGPLPGDYHGPAMEAEMLAHGYYLQALIYTLALHRHLRASLPGYRPEDHLGGAYYLFVRGIRPDFSPNSPRDTTPGILHWQVPLPLLEALERLLSS